MIKIIAKWDPFKYGEEFYETEAVDVVQAVYDEDDPPCWRNAFSIYLKLLLNKRCRSTAAGKWLASFYTLKTAAPAHFKKPVQHRFFSI